MSGLKEEEDGEEDEDEEEEEEGFFQKVPPLPLSWPLSRRLWLGPQCSKLPPPSCCRQPPPAGPPGDGDGWLKSFQRSRRMCFTSKSFRPEPDMLDPGRQRDLGSRSRRRASWRGWPAEPRWRRRRDVPSAPGALGARRAGCAPCLATSGARTAEPRGSAAVGSAGPAGGEPTGREGRQERDAAGGESSVPVRGPRGDGGEARPCWWRCARERGLRAPRLGRRRRRLTPPWDVPVAEPLSGRGPLSCPCSPRVQSWRAQRKSPRSRRGAHRSLLGAPAPLPLASRRMP